MKPDAFGFARLYRGHTHEASRIRDVFAAEPELPRTLDRVTAGAFLDGKNAADRTFFAGVRPVARLDFPTPRRRDFGGSLRSAVRRIFESAPRPIAVALSGGLDSAVVLALVLELDANVPSLVLAPRLEGYDERDAALTTARALGASAETIAVTADDFREHLPAAIDAIEVPIYNLHPVSKWLLARAARATGFATVISGDAADHVFTRDVSGDYLPLASAAFAAAGVTLRTPFLDDDVVAHVLASAPDREKCELRDFAGELGVRDELVREKKISRLTPAIDLEGVASPEELSAVATAIDRPLPDFAAADDRTHVRWTTLALLARAASRWA